MAKVTEKNTKKEILEALKEAEAKLAERREANTTTADVVRAKEVEAKKNDAKEIVEMNILNSDITAKYKNLLDTVDMLEREIQELHEVKAGLDTLEALMIVQNNKKATFETEMAEKKANFDELMAQKKAEEEADIEALKARYNKLSAELREEYAELRKELEKTRKREAEEFEYNLKRERAIENDRWADEKASREKVLAAKEAAVAEREALAEEKDRPVLIIAPNALCEQWAEEINDKKQKDWETLVCTSKTKNTKKFKKAFAEFCETETAGF